MNGEITGIKSEGRKQQCERLFGKLCDETDIPGQDYPGKKKCIQKGLYPSGRHRDRHAQIGDGENLQAQT